MPTNKPRSRDKDLPVCLCGSFSCLNLRCTFWLMVILDLRDPVVHHPPCTATILKWPGTFPLYPAQDVLKLCGPEISNSHDNICHCGNRASAGEVLCSTAVPHADLMPTETVSLPTTPASTHRHNLSFRCNVVLGLTTRRSNAFPLVG